MTGADDNDIEGFLHAATRSATTIRAEIARLPKTDFMTFSRFTTRSSDAYLPMQNLSKMCVSTPSEDRFPVISSSAARAS